MGNVLNIARKEFVDLLSSRVVFFILILYLIVVVYNVYDFNVGLNGGIPGAKLMYSENTGIAADNFLFRMLTWVGMIVGIIIGCSAISSERMGNTLNTLIVKPLYRDTIINGKLLGAFMFMICFIIFTMALFTSGLLILCGNALVPFIFDYFCRLPFVFLFAIVYMSVFLSISLLISLLIRDQAIAMVVSTLTVYVSIIVCFPNVTSCMDKVFPGFGFHQLGLSLSPENILIQAEDKLMNVNVDAYDAFLNILPETTKLLVYVIIAVVLSYIVFVRRDIS